jgi:hypothetical protein
MGFERTHFHYLFQHFVKTKAVIFSLQLIYTLLQRVVFEGHINSKKYLSIIVGQNIFTSGQVLGVAVTSKAVTQMFPL